MTRVRLHTSHGDIVLALDDENAPATVANSLSPPCDALILTSDANPTPPPRDV